MEDLTKLGRELREDEIDRIPRKLEGHVLLDFERVLFALVEANKRGEHVWYKWPGYWRDDGILYSDGLETIDDAYKKYIGCTYQEQVDKDNKWLEEYEEEERKKEEYIKEHAEELINDGKLLFASDPEKVAEWQEDVTEAVDNNEFITFCLYRNSIEIIKAIQADDSLNMGLELLKKYEPGSSGMSYKCIKASVCHYLPEKGKKLYELYEAKEKKIDKDK